MIICGIDPGLKGGIAIIDGNKAFAYPIPISGKDINVSALVETLRSHKVELVICELVHSMPAFGKDGKRTQGIASAFTFGKGYGMVLGAVMGAGIPLELVTPQKWKGSVLSGTAKDKEAAIDFCTRRYPQVNLILPRCRKQHDGMADALCIAHYGLLIYLREVA